MAKRYSDAYIDLIRVLAEVDQCPVKIIADLMGNSYDNTHSLLNDHNIKYVRDKAQAGSKMRLQPIWRARRLAHLRKKYAAQLNALRKG